MHHISSKPPPFLMACMNIFASCIVMHHILWVSPLIAWYLSHFSYRLPHRGPFSCGCPLRCACYFVDFPFGVSNVLWAPYFPSAPPPLHNKCTLPGSNVQDSPETCARESFKSFTSPLLGRHSGTMTIYDD